MGTHLGGRDAEFGAKLVRFLGVLDRLFGIDFSAIYELGEVGIQLNHSVFCSGLEFRFDEVDLIFTDQIRNRGGIDHDFESCDAAAAGFAHEDLGDDSHNGSGELGADHLFGVSRKCIHDPCDGSGGSRGVESSEDQVTRFRSGHGRFDRFKITHFAHENDIGILSKGPADCFSKAGYIHVDFALGYDAFLVGMIVLDRVFDGDDVRLSVLVDPVYHGRERGRLSRSGRTGYKNQAAGAGQQGLNGGGKTDLVHREKATGDEPKNEAVVFLGFQDADAETCILPKRDGKICTAFSF